MTMISMSRPFRAFMTHAALGAICLLSAGCRKPRPTYLRHFTLSARDRSDAASYEEQGLASEDNAIPVELTEWKV
jgi:hypothetical protein